jgi:NAD+ kinase
MNTIKTIAVFSRPDSGEAWGHLHRVLHWARSKNIEVLSGLENNPYGPWTGQGWDAAFCAEVRASADLVLSIGGDGTLLGVARALFGWKGPLLGVNLGHLGFLTDVAARDLEKALDRILAEDFYLENRILLAARVNGDAPTYAFNDVVLSKGEHGRMIEFDVFVDGLPVYRQRSDGLIITTPTGSTAYALSANGPILHPSLPAVALVPLCPHSLSARPITLPSSANIEIVMRGAVPGRVHCDGQEDSGLVTEGQRLVVTQADLPVTMLHLNGYSIYEALREKLHWSEVLTH